MILMAPEGRLVETAYWKSGFRRIARAAGVPVVLSFLDGPRAPEGRSGHDRLDDVGADMDAVRAFYADKRGVEPSSLRGATPAEETALDRTSPYRSRPPMSASFEELDRRDTPIGVITVRRRLEPTLQVGVTR